MARYYLSLHRKIGQRQFIRKIESDRLRFATTTFLTAGFSSLLAPALLTPFDHAKTKTFCELAHSSESKYTTYWRSLRNIVSKDGFKSLWRGYVLSGIFSFSHSVSLLALSHTLASGPRVDFTRFFVLNTAVSTFLYPFDTLM